MTLTQWITENIPDQGGRVTIITGGNSGIGFETARVLAEKGATVILAVRNPEKGRMAAAAIQTEFPTALLEVRILDLADLASIRNFADMFMADFQHLDLLINNAGIMIPPYGKTADGFELQFGTNHLGHFALTAQLFKLLKVTPGSRIVNVSSNAHKIGRLNFDDLNWENRKYQAWKAYGDSKLANLYFTYELSRRIQVTEYSVTATAAHPGFTVSNLAKGPLIRGFNAIFAQSTAMGALPTLMAATEPTAKSGNYFGPSGKSQWRGFPRRVFSNRLSHDAVLAEKLWQVSEEMTGLAFPL